MTDWCTAVYHKLLFMLSSGKGYIGGSQRSVWKKDTSFEVLAWLSTAIVLSLWEAAPQPRPPASFAQLCSTCDSCWAIFGSSFVPMLFFARLSVLRILTKFSIQTRESSVQRSRRHLYLVTYLERSSVGPAWLLPYFQVPVEILRYVPVTNIRTISPRTLNFGHVSGAVQHCLRVTTPIHFSTWRDSPFRACWLAFALSWLVHTACALFSHKSFVRHSHIKASYMRRTACGSSLETMPHPATCVYLSRFPH